MRGSWEAGNTSSLAAELWLWAGKVNTTGRNKCLGGGCQTAVSTGSEPGRELLRATATLALRAVGGTGSVQHRTVRRNTVSVAQKVYWEEHNQFSTEIFLLVFFHSTEQCVLGWSDTFGPYLSGR